jgi:hypothetical protein
MQDIYRRHFVITLGMQKRRGRISRAKTLAAEARSSVDPGYVTTKLTGFQDSKPESITDSLRLSCLGRIHGGHGQDAQLVRLKVAATLSEGAG